MPHLRFISERLFAYGINGNEVLECCDSDRNFVTRRFRKIVGDSIWNYISKCRFEVALKLLRETEIRVARIAHLLGIGCRSTFSDAFERWSGMRPDEFRKKWRVVEGKAGRPAEDVHSLPLLAELRDGSLDSSRARALLAFLEALDAQPGKGPPKRVPAVLESGPNAAESARCLWDLLEPLSAEERRARIRMVRTASPKLFHLLIEKNRAELRRSGRRCLVLAELALEFLEVNAALLGHELPRLRALGLAWLANARRLIGDHAGAKKTFAEARAQWRASGEDHEVEAEICRLEATLAFCERRREQALELLNRSIAVATAGACPRILVGSLLTRVCVIGPQGRIAEAMKDLRLAQRQLPKLDDPALELNLGCHLAWVCMETGRYDEAVKVLPRTYELSEALDEPVTRHQLQWTEGLTRKGLGEAGESERLLQTARCGLTDCEAMGDAAMASLDLAILYHEQGHTPELAALAAELIPVLESLCLRGEALASLRLLRDALATGTITLKILNQVRACVYNSLYGGGKSTVSANNAAED
ncbi:MAG: helix-turn-helix domain-containing protein [bacterium]|nr:helix-turn-helix domain-containing protein [bacterium]